MATSKYNLDINKQAIIKPLVILRQGDYGIDTMQVSLSVANEPMDLTGATIKFMGTTANGRQIIDDAHVKIIDAHGGVFEYVFPSEAASDVGEYKVAYFSIVQANGQSSTMDFRVQVLSGVDITASEASGYISQYGTLVTKLNSAYDSATKATNQKMASTVSSLATSAATVLDSALARVNNVNSTANSASSAASKAVSMASSVATAVTSQASYINSVASSAASNVSSVAAGVVDKLNNISVGGRNLLLDTGRSFTGVGNNSDNGNFDAQGGQYYLAGGKKVSDLYNQYGPSQYLTVSFDWEASGDNISGQFTPQWSGIPWGGGLGVIQPSNTNKSGHFKSSVQLNRGGYSTGPARSVQFRQDNLQGNITIRNMKLEAGNIATDWSPAPEDVDNKIDNIKVGGRNLYLNSKVLSDSYGINSNATVIVEPFDSATNMWHIVSPQGRGTNVGIYMIGFATGKIPNDSDWSYSADIKGTGNIRLFGIEDSTTFNTKGAIGSDWSRISQTGRSGTSQRKTLVIYFDTTNSPVDVYIKLPKLEIGNVATDWSPAPEDVDSTTFKNARRLPDNARDFAVIASDTIKYQGIWYTDGTAIANGPTSNWNWCTIEVLSGFGNGSGIIRTAGFGPNQEYVTTVNSGKVTGWNAVASVDKSVQKAGDTMSGNLTAPQVIATDLLTGFHNVIQVPTNVTKIIDLINNEFIKGRGFWKEATYIAYNTQLSDAPTNDMYSIIKMATRGSNRTYVEYSDLSGNVWHTTATTNTLLPWVKQANDADVVHKIGNETVAGDKTLTGNTTLAQTTILAGNYGLRVTPSGFQKTTDGRTWVSANI